MCTRSTCSTWPPCSTSISRPAIESLDVQLFAEDDIPWDDLAFPTIRTTLELFFADRTRAREGGGYGFHARDITRPMRGESGGSAPVHPTERVTRSA